MAAQFWLNTRCPACTTMTERSIEEATQRLVILNAVNSRDSNRHERLLSNESGILSMSSRMNAANVRSHCHCVTGVVKIDGGATMPPSSDVSTASDYNELNSYASGGKHLKLVSLLPSQGANIANDK